MPELEAVAGHGHGWWGVVLKPRRGRDFALTVTGVEDVTENCRRVRFADGGLLAAAGVRPTMGVRVWLPGGQAQFARRELAVAKGRLPALGYWRP